MSPVLDGFESRPRHFWIRPQFFVLFKFITEMQHVLQKVPDYYRYISNHAWASCRKFGV